MAPAPMPAVWALQALPPAAPGSSPSGPSTPGGCQPPRATPQPKNGDAFAVRAGAKSELGDHCGAVADCTEVLKITPNQVGALVRAAGPGGVVTASGNWHGRRARPARTPGCS